MLPVGIAIAVAAGVATTPHRGARRSGQEPGHGAARLSAQPLGLLAPEATAAGQVRLRWSGIPQADSYVVSLLDGELDPLKTLGSSRTPELAVDPADFPHAPGDRPLWWMVVALREGQIIARSDAGPLRLP